MKQDEKGSTLLELIIAISIMVLVSGATLAGIFQISKTTDYGGKLRFLGHVSQVVP